MTPDQAADLAARTLAAIDTQTRSRPFHNLNRERVASDLAGLRECYADSTSLDGNIRMRSITRRHCARYAANLRRTAALYGEAP